MSNLMTLEMQPTQPVDDLPSLSGLAKTTPSLPVAYRYVLTLIAVAVTTMIALIVDRLIDAPNLSIVFVVPVVIAAVSFGWGPALAAAVMSVLAFDFFFIAPTYSLHVDSPTDLWALALLLVIAAIVSTVAARSRRLAMEAREAADQAQALQALAHLVLQSPPQDEVVRAAAEALARIFRAPAAVLIETSGKLSPAALAGGASLSSADREAAGVALASHSHVRADAYPVDQARFDFWPVLTPAGSRSVLGVSLEAGGKDRPNKPEQFVEVVGAYLAMALAREAAAQDPGPLPRA